MFSQKSPNNFNTLRDVHSFTNILNVVLIFFDNKGWLDWELLFEKWPMSQDAFEWFPKVSQDALVFIRSVSRRFGIYSKASQDAFEWFIQKRLETFRINTKASWDTLGNHSKASQDAFNIHSKCLKTLWRFIQKRLETFRMNFECVLRHRSLFE